MQRRTFVELVGASATAAALPLRIPLPRREPFRLWTWVHGNDTDSLDTWRAKFGRLRSAGISGVLVGGGNNALIASAAKAEGLTYHAWTFILNRSGDAYAKEHYPDWFDISRKGESSLTHPPYVGYYQWFCPTRPGVRDYLQRQVTEIAEIAGVDAVHLDYIRHPDVILPRGLWAKYNLVQDHEMPEYDFCYCQVCRDTFKSESGYDPLSLADPTQDIPWRQFRWNSITQLVTQLAAAVRAHNCDISAAVFPTPTLARMQVRQAWDQWPLDAVFPMLYHKFHDEDIPWIGRSVQEDVAAVAGREPVYAGLYLPDLPPDAMMQAVNLARESGAAGVSLFDSGGLTDAHLQALRGLTSA
ncbi:MAG TPA: hypothetical protein VGM77_09320 [Gemmatimonadales bacterium]